MRAESSEMTTLDADDLSSIYDGIIIVAEGVECTSPKAETVSAAVRRPQALRASVPGGSLTVIPRVSLRGNFAQILSALYGACFAQFFCARDIDHATAA